MFKNALCKLIVTENLPFNFVESVAFVELLKVLNPDVENLLVKADAIAEHVMVTFHEQKKNLLICLKRAVLKLV